MEKIKSVSYKYFYLFNIEFYLLLPRHYILNILPHCSFNVSIVRLFHN